MDKDQILDTLGQLEWERGKLNELRTQASTVTTIELGPVIRTLNEEIIRLTAIYKDIVQRESE